MANTSLALSVSASEVRFSEPVTVTLTFGPDAVVSLEAVVRLCEVDEVTGDVLPLVPFSFWFSVADRIEVQSDGTRVVSVKSDLYGIGYFSRPGSYKFCYAPIRGGPDEAFSPVIKVSPLVDIAVEMEMAEFAVDVGIRCTFPVHGEPPSPDDYFGVFPIEAPFPSNQEDTSGLWYFAKNLRPEGNSGVFHIIINMREYLVGPGAYVVRYHTGDSSCVAGVSQPITFYSTRELIVNQKVNLGESFHVFVDDTGLDRHHDRLALHRVNGDDSVVAVPEGHAIMVDTLPRNQEGLRVATMTPSHGGPTSVGRFVYRYHTRDTAAKRSRYSAQSSIITVESLYKVDAPATVVESTDGTRLVQVTVTYPPGITRTGPHDRMAIYRAADPKKVAFEVEHASEAMSEIVNERVVVSFTFILPEVGNFALRHWVGDLEVGCVVVECVGVLRVSVSPSSRADGRHKLPEPITVSVAPSLALEGTLTAWVGLFAPDSTMDVAVTRPTYWQSLPPLSSTAASTHVIFTDYPCVSVSYEFRVFEEGTSRLLGCSRLIYFQEDKLIAAQRREEERVRTLNDLEAFYTDYVAQLTNGTQKEGEVEVPPLTEVVTRARVSNAGNTCYIDSSIMAMFAGTDVFDNMIMSNSEVSEALVPLRAYLKDLVVRVRRGEAIDAKTMERFRFVLRKSSSWEADDIRDHAGRMEFGSKANQQDARELVQVMQELLNCPWMVARPTRRHLNAQGEVIHESQRGMEQSAAIMLSLDQTATDFAIPLQSLYDSYFDSEIEGYKPEHHVAARYVMHYNVLGECSSSVFSTIMKTEQSHKARTTVSSSSPGTSLRRLTSSASFVCATPGASASSGSTPAEFPPASTTNNNSSSNNNNNTSGGSTSASTATIEARLAALSLAHDEKEVVVSGSTISSLEENLVPLQCVTIILKRFGNDLTKNESQVSISEVLEPTGLHGALKKIPNQVHKLRLCSVVCHTGQSPNSGHYYAFFRRENDWFKFDDCHVPNIVPAAPLALSLRDLENPSDDQKALLSEAYILFYEVITS